MTCDDEISTSEVNFIYTIHSDKGPGPQYDLTIRNSARKALIPLIYHGMEARSFEFDFGSLSISSPYLGTN